LLKQRKRPRKKGGGMRERLQDRHNQNMPGIEERPRGRRPQKEKKTDWRDYLIEEEGLMDES